MLRDVVELNHRLVDLCQPPGLLKCRSRDLPDQTVDLLNRIHDVVHGFACAVDQLPTVRNLGDRRIDQALDLFGSCGRALRQTAHLGGYDCKAAALLARSRGLDGRVQGEDVGLERDSLDDLD